MNQKDIFPHSTCSSKCTVSNRIKRVSELAHQAHVEGFSSAHDQIAKNQRYIIIYTTQIRSSNMNSLPVTFVNNSLVDLWMTNSLR